MVFEEVGSRVRGVLAAQFFQIRNYCRQLLYSDIRFRPCLLAVVAKALYRERQRRPMTEVESLTRRLVEIPSHEDEEECGDEIESWLRRETDAEVDRDDVGNVFARRGEPRFALVGHHDTVPPAEQQVDEDGRLVCERRDGRLLGRGTADMKAAVAAAMLAFRDSSGDDVAFASFVGEEVGGVGARYAVEEGFAPERAVVLEGSAGYSSGGSVDIAVAHRGRRELELTTHGRASHAAEGSDDDNAVYLAADEVDRVRGFEPPTYTARGGRLEGGATVTMIEGGETSNVVPDRCSLVVDERTVPGGKPYTAGPQVDREVVDEMPAMECRDPTLVEAAVDAAGSDGAAERVVKPHATDAGHLDRAGVECVVVGPAEKGEAHSDEESVSLDVVERCRGVYRRLLDDERLT